jgi:effector-binding domain-containing protein
MKKSLKISLVVAGILAFVIFVPPVFMSSQYNASSSIVIKSSAYNVFPYFADLRNWEKWSPWKEKDPNIKYEYSDNSYGAGSTVKWESKNEQLGSGKIKTVQFKKFHHINYELEMIKPSQLKSGGQLMVEKINNQQVKVTWTNIGKLSYPFGRWINVFMNFKKMIEKDLGHGLEKMKTIVESGPQKILPALHPETIQLPEQHIFSVMHETVRNAEIGSKTRESYEAILRTMKDKGIEQVEQPPICIFYKHTNVTSRMRPGIFVPGCAGIVLNNGVECIPLYGDKVLRFAYYGEYTNMESTYDAIDIYIEENKISKKRDYTWEAYVASPGTDKDSTKWMTYIYVPIR